MPKGETLLKGISNKDLAMLLLALKTAKTSDERFKVGAVAVSGGRVIGVACNKGRNHPTVLEDEDIKNHASICAERRLLAILGKKVKGATIYVARAKKNGSFALSEPCDRCKKALNIADIKKVVYSS
jgi:tRNA(Arg) A34 adenosine deaminase TadA